MSNTSATSPATTRQDPIGMEPVRTAVERLTEYRDAKEPGTFPRSALTVVSNFLDAVSGLGDSVTQAIAQQQQLRYSNHSLRRIALGMEAKPQEFAVIALKHVMGPAQAQQYLQDYPATALAKSSVPVAMAELTPAMEDAFYGALPTISREQANHPNDTGNPDYSALKDPTVLAKCFAAAMAAQKA